MSVFADAVRGFTSWLSWLYKQKQIKYRNQKQKKKGKKRKTKQDKKKDFNIASSKKSPGLRTGY